MKAPFKLPVIVQPSQYDDRMRKHSRRCITTEDKCYVVADNLTNDEAQYIAHTLNRFEEMKAALEEYKRMFEDEVKDYQEDVRYQEVDALLSKLQKDQTK